VKVNYKILLEKEENGGKVMRVAGKVEFIDDKAPRSDD